MIGAEEPVGKPMYEILRSAASTLALVEAIGADEFDARLRDEVRAAMDEYGTRVVLWYGEKLANVAAVLEEFSVDAD